MPRRQWSGPWPNTADRWSNVGHGPDSCACCVLRSKDSPCRNRPARLPHPCRPRPVGDGIMAPQRTRRSDSEWSLSGLGATLLDLAQQLQDRNAGLAKALQTLGQGIGSPPLLAVVGEPAVVSTTGPKFCLVSAD